MARGRVKGFKHSEETKLKMKGKRKVKEEKVEEQPEVKITA
jgi:hypothetical protein